MRSKIVPINKQSKKNKKAFNAIKRLTWGNVHPSTKTFKTVNRRDERNKDRNDYEDIERN